MTYQYGALAGNHGKTARSFPLPEPDMEKIRGCRICIVHTAFIPNIVQTKDVVPPSYEFTA